MGRDHVWPAGSEATLCFNPRAHMGRDYLGLGWGVRHIVSIHAPTWGATMSLSMMILKQRFQSTRPHGARRRFQGQRARIKGSFNPRAHMGRDIIRKPRPNFARVFQSTRPHGARLRQTPALAVKAWFQSTRPHGARPRSALACRGTTGFNPRAHMGRDKVPTRDT